MSGILPKIRMHREPPVGLRSSSSNSFPTRARQRGINAQNFVVIWLDSNISESYDDLETSITQLFTTVKSLEIYTDATACALFLTQIKDQKILLIVSGSLGQIFIPLVHENPNLYSIYIFCPMKETNIQYAKNWYKVRGVLHGIDSVCHYLKQDIRRCEHDLEPMSIMPLTDSSTEELNKLDQSFMYTQILKEALLDMNYDVSAMKELTDTCCDVFRDNADQLVVIQEFETDYYKHTPIWWYTRECFTYHMLNRALRTLDLDILIKMGFFMRDVHQQIQELQSQSVLEKPFIVYRGQGMLPDEFERLQNSNNGLLSFNSFLSTSLEEPVSLNFARNARDKFGMIGIVFRMEIDPATTTAPFAAVDDLSYYKNTEKEILFSMHTVFQIYEINNLDDQLWEVELKITADDDQYLRVLTEHIRFEIRGATASHRLGNLMIHLGHLDKAEKFYRLLLDSTSQHDQIEIVNLNNQLAIIMEQKGDYREARRFYQTILEFEENFYPSTHRRLADIYHNLGIVNKELENYKDALFFFQRALEIAQHNNFPASDPRLKMWKDNIEHLQTKI